jgi:hypothetical protein
MKYLRRFDEELNPSTYRTAGQRLMRAKFDEERGATLIDYGNEKEFGFYNILVGNTGGKFNNGVPLTFTNPKATFYFNSIESDFYGNYGTTELVKNKTAEELVQSWKKGDDLAFTISFRFQATEESKSKYSHSELETRAGTSIFSFRVELSDWYGGLDEWNTDQDTGDMIVGDEAHDIYDMFVNSSYHPKITLQRPDNKFIFGIFSDRASANKFVMDLPRLLEPFEGHIHDIISAIGGDPEHTDKIKMLFPSTESLFGSISVNSLYDTNKKASIPGNNFSNRWFHDNVISTKK